MKQEVREDLCEIKKAFPLMSDYQRGEIAGIARYILLNKEKEAKHDTEHKK